MPEIYVRILITVASTMRAPSTSVRSHSNEVAVAKVRAHAGRSTKTRHRHPTATSH